MKPSPYLKCARAVLRRKNSGYYPEFAGANDEYFVRFNSLFGDVYFADQPKELLCLMLCFMDAVEAEAPTRITTTRTVPTKEKP